jgi:ABC-type transport system substrate-binding protein
MYRNTGLRLAIALLLLVTVLSGVSAAATAEKDSVTMAIPTSDLNTLDPHNSNMIVDRVVRANIFDCLMYFHQGTYENVLIDGYELSADGLNYTFRLKKGVKFHNGEELTANDIIYSMARAKQSTVMATFTSIISKVTAQDKYTAVISLEKPYVPFIHAVAANVPIMNEKAVLAYGDTYHRNPVGTGPYKFVKWDAGQQIVLERFSDWHGGTAPIKSATFLFLSDPNSALMATETGEIDLTFTMPPIAVPEIEKSGKLNLVKAPTLASGFLVFNLERGPLTDKNLRLAMSYAVDKQEIVDVALEGLGVVSKGLWDERAGGYSGSYKPVTKDLDKAREYLARSNYKGEELNFIIGYEYYRKVATLVQEQFRKIGINARVSIMESNAWLSEVRKGNYDLTTVNMSMEFDVEFWANAFHSRGIGGFNFGRMNLPVVDRAFDEGKSIIDPDKRKAVYASIERVLYEDASVYPHYFQVIPVAFNKKLAVSRFTSIGYARVIDMQWNK